MYCINCGSFVPEDGKFCANCGHKVEKISNVQKEVFEEYKNSSEKTVTVSSEEPKARRLPSNNGEQTTTYGAGTYTTNNGEQATTYGTGTYTTTYESGNQTYGAQGVDYGMGIPNGTNTKPKKRKGRGCLITLLVIIGGIVGLFILLCVALVWLFGEEEESEPNYNYASANQLIVGSSYEGEGGYSGIDLGLTDVRDFYTTVKGDGSDIVTVMIYLLGSDLETDSGCATDDLMEIAEADFGDQVNVVVMTGGTLQWQNDFVDSDTCQYWQIKDGEFYCLEDDLGKISMANEDTLSAFISDMASQFPADRYQLICWNHGGGTMGGYGYDEHYPETMMTLDDISDALEEAGVLFDLVGFDACLMGTVETAVMLEPYADYLLASAEIEPGTGWYYTDWLTLLGNNTSISTVELGSKIIDDFIEESSFGFFQDEITLSIVELRQIPYTYEILCEYFSGATITLDSSSYHDLATARSNTKAYGEGEYEQVDAIDFIQNANLDGSQEVIDSINNAVKYYRNSDIIENSNGIALYFPYYYPQSYSGVQEVLMEVGYTDNYTEFFDSFISAMSGGQNQHHRSSGGETAEVDYSDESWYDAEIADAYAEMYDESLFYELPIIEKRENFALHLSDEAWDEIISIELQVLLDDGEGYIDLGSDNVYEFDNDGDLIIEFDYTWVTLDGHTVPFYAEKEVYNDDDNWYTYGSVPAMLKGEDYIEIIVYWDSENPTGYVAGYRKYSEAGTPMGKGMMELEAGATIEWVFDYYTYDIEYVDSYIMGETFIVPETEIEVSYDDVGNQDAYVFFRLIDIYNNIYDSEAIIYTDE
ncbi:MAG: clostripain-related cysteine peptidase [Eubacteriales bacterium]